MSKKAKPRTIETLLKSAGPRMLKPYHLIDPDLRKVIAAKQAGKPVPTAPQLSDFFFDKHGVQFARDTIRLRIKFLERQQNDKSGNDSRTSKRRVRKSKEN